MLLVTHGGYNSIIEAAIYGVPMISIPVYFDQLRNSQQVEFKGLGKVLWPKEITTKKFGELVKEVLTNKK